jgi:hypothetical protein
MKATARAATSNVDFNMMIFLTVSVSGENSPTHEFGSEKGLLRGHGFVKTTFQAETGAQKTTG